MHRSESRVDVRLLSSAVALTLGTFALAATPARAQEPAESTAAPGREAGTLEVIVVTAQRREERLQDVPIAVSVVSSEQLESRRITNLLNLKALAPNLLVSKYPNSNVASQVAIRGGVTVNGAMYWEPSTGLYLDGVYLGKAVGSVFDLVDAERIEVLRGPQGTLYGRNTMAGAVNLITRAPTGEFAANASLEIGNYRHNVQKLSFDLPKIGIARMSFGEIGRAHV